MKGDKLYSTFVFPFRWPSGQWKAVIVAKAAFNIRPNQQAHISQLPPEIVIADTYFDDDPAASVRHASDLVPEKPNIDCVVLGRVFSSVNTNQVQVYFRLSKIRKHLTVLGRRRWKNGLLGFGLTNPEPLENVEIRFEHAYGGVDTSRSRRCINNPHGSGYQAFRSKLYKEELSVPSIFYKEDSISNIGKNTKPAGFGHMSGDWQLRSQYLGTYDEKWKRERCPDLAEDFDFRYFNSAPPDQQLPMHDIREQQVELINMHPEFKYLTFRLANDYPVLTYEDATLSMTMDTVCFLPDQLTYLATWRTNIDIPDADTSHIVESIKIKSGQT